MNLWYIGANTGVAVVEKTGGIVGGEGGFRVWKNLDLVGEVVWMQNVVTRAQLDKATTIANYLSTSQGQAATSNVEVPATYWGFGGRWVFEQVNLKQFRPYVIATFGSGYTNIKSTFTLGGADITGSLPQYGVTLGSDLAGKSNHFATDTGGGAVWATGAWYTDFGVRLVSIGGQDQRTNVFRLVVGGGYRF
ncbi:MAG TPA: hypothetical protein VJN96_25190 [Vicinamibacterales bacterium]|nr:hypothetical protein [Vicinamibacterales bacterium]